MHLKLRRSQRTSGMLGKTVLFCLDARLDLDPEEAASVRKYALGSQVIYNSAASRKHLESAATAMVQETGGSFARMLASSAMARLSLNITIDSLTKGQHIECKDLDELLGAESAIMDASRSTRTYLDMVKTFDGREIVIDLDAPAEAAA